MYYRLLAVLHLLSLGVALGGILLFGVGVAGNVFDPAFIPSRTSAGALNSAILERLTMLLVVCAVVAMATILPARFARPRRSGSLAVAMAFLFALIVTYLGFFLFPDVDALRIAIGSFDPVLAEKQGLYERFGELHDRFSLLVRIAAVCALAGFVISARHAGNPVVGSWLRRLPVAAGRTGIETSESSSRKNATATSDSGEV